MFPTRTLDAQHTTRGFGLFAHRARATRHRRKEGHWHPLSGTALRENATADGVQTSRARTLTGATLVPSATQLSSRKTRARFHHP